MNRHPRSTNGRTTPRKKAVAGLTVIGLASSLAAGMLPGSVAAGPPIGGPLGAPPDLPVFVGKVWLDSDNDGLKSASERGIAGVAVTLWDVTSDVAVGTHTTDSNGNYAPWGSITGGMTPGHTFELRQAQPTGLANGTVNPTNISPQFTWAGMGSPSAPAGEGDFSEVGASLSGIVSQGGVPRSGATVQVFDENLTLVTSAITDGSGIYTVADLPTGSYVLRVANAAGTYTYESIAMILTEGEATTAAGIDTTGPSITGTVAFAAWGKQSLPNVTITLQVKDIDAGTWSDHSTAMTDTDGAFSFTELDPGTYRTVETQYDVIVDGPTGGTTNVTSDGSTSIEYEATPTSGRFHVEYLENGVLLQGQFTIDGDVQNPGVVQLLSVDPQTGAFRAIDTAFTDSDGVFSFPNQMIGARYAFRGFGQFDATYDSSPFTAVIAPDPLVAVAANTADVAGTTTATTPTTTTPTTTPVTTTPTTTTPTTTTPVTTTPTTSPVTTTPVTTIPMPTIPTIPFPTMPMPTMPEPTTPVTSAPVTTMPIPTIPTIPPPTNPTIPMPTTPATTTPVTTAPVTTTPVTTTPETTTPTTPTTAPTTTAPTTNPATAPSIAGSVSFAHGTRGPIADVGILLEIFDTSREQWVVASDHDEVYTAEDGTFSFTGLTPGARYRTYRSFLPGLTVVPVSNNVDDGIHSTPFVAPADGSVTTIDYLLDGVAMSGHVTVGDVSAADGVTVQLRDPRGNVIRSTMTDASGDYVFWNLPSGWSVYTTAVGTDGTVYPIGDQTNARPDGLAPDKNPDVVAPVNAGYDITMAAGSSPDAPSETATPTTTPTTPSTPAATIPAATIPASNTPIGSLDVNASTARIVDTRNGTGGIARLAAGVPVTVTADLLRSATGATPVAAVVQLTAVGASGAGYLTAYPCGITPPLASSVNYVASDAASALATVQLDAAGRFCVVSSKDVDLVIDRFATYDTAASSQGGRFVTNPNGPSRLVDTRTPSGGGRFAPGEVRTYQAPAGAKAVMINLAATNSDGGWVAVYRTSTGWAGTSNLNLRPGETRSNAAVVPVGADGSFSVRTQRGADIVIDVLGTFTSDAASASAGGVFHPMTPSRVLDTRNGTALAADGTMAVDVSAAGIPAGATAVAATVTAIGSNGYLTAWSTGPRPVASNVNGAATGIVPNMVYVGLSQRAFQLYSQAGGDVVIDVVGYFTES